METNNTINDRIIQFVEYLDIDLDVFAHLCDVKSDTILNEHFDPNSSCIKKILSIYPELNPKWIKYGAASMLGSADESFGEIEVSPSELMIRKMTLAQVESGIMKRLGIYMSYLRRYLTMHEEMATRGLLYNSLNSALSTLQMLYPNINMTWLVYGEGDMVYDWKQFGLEVMPNMKKVPEKGLSNSDKMTAEWALRSYGFRWVRSCVKIGMQVQDILSIFNNAQKEIPDIVNTRDGNSLSENTLKSWIYIATQIIPKYLSEYK